jgi:hypothetical protein
MMFCQPISRLAFAFGMLGIFHAVGGSTLADEGPLPGTRAYKLRYKFKPGETLRWQVEHRAQVRTTVAGTTQTAETLSRSVKVWKIDAVDDGQTTLVYHVESVDMRQKFDGRQETTYNSDTDESPPAGFADVAKAVGVPLATITLDVQGKVLKRKQQLVQAAPEQEYITLPLPEKSVAVGEQWFEPTDITVNLKDGRAKKIKARQRYLLKDVSAGVATIQLETQLLSPVRDPEIEAQLVQSKANGTVRFDIEAGRVVSQRSDVDEHVVGFEGDGTSLHYVTRFTEEFLSDTKKTALGPKAPVQRK